MDKINTSNCFIAQSHYNDNDFVSYISEIVDFCRSKKHNSNFIYHENNGLHYLLISYMHHNDENLFWVTDSLGKFQSSKIKTCSDLLFLKIKSDTSYADNTYVLINNDKIQYGGYGCGIFAYKNLKLFLSHPELFIKIRKNLNDFSSEKINSFETPVEMMKLHQSMTQLAQSNKKTDFVKNGIKLEQFIQTGKTWDNVNSYAKSEKTGRFQNNLLDYFIKKYKDKIVPEQLQKFNSPQKLEELFDKYNFACHLNEYNQSSFSDDHNLQNESSIIKFIMETAEIVGVTLDPY